MATYPMPITARYNARSLDAGTHSSKPVRRAMTATSAIATPARMNAYWQPAVMGSGGRIYSSTMTQAMSVAMTETETRMMRARLAVLPLVAAMVYGKHMKLAMTVTAVNWTAASAIAR